MSILILDKAISYIFPISFIATPFLIVNWAQYVWMLYKNRQLDDVLRVVKFPYKSVLAFIVPILLIFLLSTVMTYMIRANVKEFLATAGASATVTVEGRTIPDAKPIILALQQIARPRAHNSHPEKKIQVIITDKAYTLLLNLRRDSARPTEYWVFFPQYQHTANNEIGRITTSLFNSYK